MSTLIDEALNTLKEVNKISENELKAGTTIFGKTGNFTADGTATEYDIASGKTAYVNGQKITGVRNSVKLFSSIEEMQNDPTAQEGELAVIYRFNTVDWDGSATSKLQILDSFTLSNEYTYPYNRGHNFNIDPYEIDGIQYNIYVTLR